MTTFSSFSALYNLQLFSYIFMFCYSADVNHAFDVTVYCYKAETANHNKTINAKTGSSGNNKSSSKTFLSLLFFSFH